MQTILEYLKRRQKQDYNPIDYSLDGVTKALEEHGYVRVDHLVDVNEWYEHTERYGEKSYVISSTNNNYAALYAYNSEARDKDLTWLYVFFKGGKEINNCSVGSTGSVTPKYIKWHGLHGPVSQINKFLEQ